MENNRFGTDGIRGIFGETLTEETAYRLGSVLGREGRLLIGRDNRPSSPLLARALACGAASVGCEVRSVGIVTTPALYYLLTCSDAPDAVMVTASHNPPDHNGLKVLTRAGKPDERRRREIEQAMAKVFPRIDPAYSLAESGDPSLYRSYLRERIGSLAGIRVVVDYARGAGSVFKGLYREMGADEIAINDRMNDEINVGCGALHPEECAREVLRRGADLGISIDGDGDRIVVVTRSGRILDGDHITYLLARRMQEHGRLRRGLVAMTVMTNSGILKSLTEHGIGVISCAVGDTALAETMRAEEIDLGGEQSGHVILGAYLPTGDGLLVGAYLMKSILEDGDLDTTHPPLVYPQILLNVPVPDKSIVDSPALRRLAAEIKSSLREGRVLLRASGTENVVRIMVEHVDRAVAESAALRLKEEILQRA